jgi:exosortase family protein XrtG
MWGSIGLFLVLMNFMDYVKAPMIEFFTYILGEVGALTGLFEGYAKYGMFFVNHNDTVISLYIDLECSGLIEMMVYIALIAFYPVYDAFDKIKTGIAGIIFIFLFNVIRVLTIILMIYYGGTKTYALAHTIIGRLVFYVLIIILYYNVFTKNQIKKQKVGSFDYNK